MAFQGQWRDYQRELLEELDQHLEDSKLHVVAAPGSGKTILGLEVLRRIGRPTIILAPTVTIRDQWRERLCSLFLKDSMPPGWVSLSMASPQSITILTYQALDTALRAGEPKNDAPNGTTPVHSTEFDAFAAHFKSLGATTLVLDEAHHLRKEWWRALTRLVAELADVKIVALTATPPYDVDPVEWRHYEALCGPIDAEIPIPALVRNGDLCPHQDLIHLSQPSKSEFDLMMAQRSDLEQTTQRLQHDQEFIQALQNHPWLVDPKQHVEEILDTPELQSAMLVFLKSAGCKIPKQAIRVLGVGNADLPLLTADLLEALLNGVLFDRPDDFALDRKWRRQLQLELGRANAISGRRVQIVDALQHYGTLAGSLAKIESVVEIVRTEASLMGEKLRLVVLADFVRAEDLNRTDHNVSPARKLGVVPIFEAIRAAKIERLSPAVLTGPLVIIPKAILPTLTTEAGKLPSASFHHQALAEDPAFVTVNFENVGCAVEVLTTLFDRGEINALVGTAALLGEGWDAPPLNSLVLASYVGSFMLSNQMRGRAIRTDPDHPDKAANIWHLATVSPTSAISFLQPMNALLGASGQSHFDAAALGADMEMLARRFRAFEGLTFNAPVLIINGIERLGLAGRSWTPDGIAQLNQEMLAHAGDRVNLADRWSAALLTSNEHPRMRQTAEVLHQPRIVTFGNTLQYLAMTAISGGFLSAINAIKGRVLRGDGADVLTLLSLLFGLALIYALPRLLLAAYLFVRNGSLEASLGSVGRVVIDSLGKVGRLQTRATDIKLRVVRTIEGKRRVEVLGATRRDEQEILDAFEEVLGPVRNPRYLLERQSWLGSHSRMDYHTVPTTLGANRSTARAFAKRWNWRVSEVKLVFLRSTKGRLVLLRARTKSLAAGFQTPFERYSIWQ